MMVMPKVVEILPWPAQGLIASRRHGDLMEPLETQGTDCPCGAYEACPGGPECVRDAA